MYKIDLVKLHMANTAEKKRINNVNTANKTDETIIIEFDVRSFVNVWIFFLFVVVFVGCCSVNRILFCFHG